MRPRLPAVATMPISWCRQHLLKAIAMNLTLPPKVTTRAFERLAEIGASAQGKALRVAVEGGGCSGFQYEIILDDPKSDDLILEGSGEKVLVDPVSLPFLAGATITFSEELIGARFVIDNPNATSSCGCGTSFSI
jgi:iron-sulfur cluster insertion protein